MLVNDVTALRGDPELASVVAGAGADLCLMHMLGEPRTMQDDPRYDDVVAEVESFLAERAEAAVAAGIARERIALDPGIGFGKTLAHNLALLRALPRLARLGPLLLGVSRKRFLGTLTGREIAADRVAASVAAALYCYRGGAHLLRVHDVARHGRRARRRAGAGGRGVTSPLTIEVRGLTVHAHHGVHEHEREHGQRFVLDLVLVPRSALGCETDRLGDTVSYGDAARVAVEVATSTRFDLIERLAAHVADTLLARMPLERATITVHKPDAPLGLDFDDVAVTVSRVRVPSVRS